MKWHTAVLVLAATLSSVSAGASAPSRTTFRQCRPTEVHALVVGFTTAFDAGDIPRLDRLFARHDGDPATPSFQWYSTPKPGARFGAEAENRATLMPYFRARHRRGERLRLVWMSSGGNANGYFGFGFHVHRAARDLRTPGTFEGKGAAVCTARGSKLAVWSVGARIASG